MYAQKSWVCLPKCLISIVIAQVIKSRLVGNDIPATGTLVRFEPPVFDESLANYHIFSNIMDVHFHALHFPIFMHLCWSWNKVLVNGMTFLHIRNNLVVSFEH